MPSIWSRLIVALGLIAGAHATALAQDTTCRAGLFTQQDRFAQARVSEPRRTFFHGDLNGCPTEGECRTDSYVIEGDILVIGRSLGDFVCALFPSPGGATAGWIRRNRLTPMPTDTAPALDRWLGEWTHGGNPEVAILAHDGEAHITGEAFWPDRPEDLDWPTIHIGEVDDRIAIAGNRATYADANLCELELTLLTDFLLIEDNRRCGGANVTFSGVYRRAGQAR